MSGKEHGSESGPAERQVRVTAEKDSVEPCKGCHRVKEDTLIVGKKDFVLFMVEVINCSAQTTKKTEKIKIILKSAEKYLGLKGMRWEAVEEMLNGGPLSSQSWADGSS